MKFRLLSAAAALATLGASASAPEEDDAGPAPSPAPTPSPAPEAAADQEVPVVAAADAAAAISAARAEGFAAANARMSKVLGSDVGKANASTAAFLLANSHASADAIIEQMSANASATAPAAAVEPTPNPAPAPAASLPDTNTNITTDPQALLGASAAAPDVFGEAIAAKVAASNPFIPSTIPSAANANGGQALTVPLRKTGN